MVRVVDEVGIKRAGTSWYPALIGAEISPYGWKFHTRLILGGQRAVQIVQGQRLKAMRGTSSWAS